MAINLGLMEDLVFENGSQTPFKTSDREAAKKGNLPKALTKISLSAEKPMKEIFFCICTSLFITTLFIIVKKK